MWQMNMDIRLASVEKKEPSKISWISWQPKPPKKQRIVISMKRYCGPANIMKIMV